MNLVCDRSNIDLQTFQRLQDYGFVCLTGTLHHPILDWRDTSAEESLNQHTHISAWQSVRPKRLAHKETQPLFFVSQIESNFPGEDRFCARMAINSSFRCEGYAIIDGHGKCPYFARVL